MVELLYSLEARGTGASRRFARVLGKVGPGRFELLSKRERRTFSSVRIWTLRVLSPEFGEVEVDAAAGEWVE